MLASMVTEAASGNKVKPPKPVKPVQELLTCKSRKSRCFMKRIKCPAECPKVKPKNPKDKACFLDCYSPKCEAVCKSRKPNCNGPGAACYDPRFIGGDGIVFYFHGKSNEHFSLLSDSDFQINARFIGLRPQGRTRDYTWIQALGLKFGQHNFTLEATKTEKWDDNVDHLKLSYDGAELLIPEGHSSEWNSNEGEIQVERTSTTNSLTVSIPDLAEISVNVIPVSEEDSKIHNYQIPQNDSFAHLEVQFRFFGLSSNVEGILGRTYRPDFENPAKPGVAMPVIGGDDKYKTSALLATDCALCLFSPEENKDEKVSPLMNYGMLDCKGENCKEWSRAIRTALRAKKKLIFIDGTMKEPDDKSPDLEDWWTVNLMLGDIKQRFSISNRPRVQQLKADLADCRLVDCFILCCECDLTIKLQKKRGEEKVHQFLMGLDVKAYGTLHSNVLSSEPIPSLNKVYAMTILKERVQDAAQVKDERDPGDRHELEKVEEDLKVMEVDVEDETWVLGDRTSRMVIGATERHEGIFFIKGVASVRAYKISGIASYDLWHQRMGHPSIKIIDLLPKSVAFMENEFSFKTIDDIKAHSSDVMISDSLCVDDEVHQMGVESHSPHSSSNNSEDVDENSKSNRHVNDTQSKDVRARDNLDSKHTSEEQLAPPLQSTASAESNPNTFADAIKDERWRVAMQKEIDALENNGTWTITDFPPGNKYALDIIFEAGLLEAKPANIPLEQHHRLALADDEELRDPECYRRLVGRLIYLTITRHEPSYYVHVLSRFMQHPLEEHWQAIVRVVRSIKDSLGQGCLLGNGGGNGGQLEEEGAA
ncbi:late embryogenesis abundant protein-related protein [Tanacetum coccineum]